MKRISARQYDIPRADLSHLPVSSSQNGTGHESYSSVITDTLKALIIFAKFKDDKFAGDPNVSFRDWPLFDSPNQLPTFANHLLSSSISAPYPDSSLTAYFFQQSMGKFLLYGEVYDSVLVSDHPEERYHRGQGGYGDLTKELLDRIDLYGFDFSEYDQNNDGLIDHIFIVLRGDSMRDRKRFVWTGASCLDGRCSGSIAGGGPLNPPAYDGKIVDWNISGSYIIHRTPGNIIPLIYHVRLMAHELGHDLWEPFFVHIPSYQRNDVPASHNRGRGRDCIAYVLMAGSGGAQDCQGSQTISAYERDLLGWIDCTVLRKNGKNLVLGDLYTTSDCYKIQLGDAAGERRLYLSNLQRIGYFDSIRRGGKDDQYDMGLLRTTGLLPMFVTGYQTDVLPADNNLQLVIDNAAYHGDLFGPTTSTQLTPWTRPNSNGYNKYPRNHDHIWFAIDNIRYNQSSASDMLFDFYTDFRTQPTIREDSWMGSGLDNYVFEKAFTVTNGSLLTIENDVTIAGHLLIDRQSAILIEEGSTLHLQASSILKMNAGTTITVAGTLILDGLLQRSIDTHIEKTGNGLIRSTLVTVD